MYSISFYKDDCTHESCNCIGGHGYTKFRITRDSGCPTATRSDARLLYYNGCSHEISLVMRLPVTTVSKNLEAILLVEEILESRF